MLDILPVFLALIGVIALMLGAMYLLKQLTQRVSVNPSAKGLKVITSAAVGQDRSIAVVRAGNKHLLIGITGGGINVLCELDERDMEMITGTDKEDPADKMAGKSFAECLSINLKKAGKDFLRPIDDNSEDNENGER